MTITRVMEAGKHSLTVPDHCALRVGILKCHRERSGGGCQLSSQAVKEALDDSLGSQAATHLSRTAGDAAPNVEHRDGAYRFRLHHNAFHQNPGRRQATPPKA